MGVDKEKTENLILEKINDEEKERFTFLNTSFEEIENLPKCDLLVSNFAIPFCHPQNFDKFWKTICNSIKSGGYFLGNFFGLEDGWKINKKMIFLNIEQVREMFEDFEMLEIKEKIYDAKTGMEIMKHWDVIDVFAKKK